MSSDFDTTLADGTQAVIDTAIASTEPKVLSHDLGNRFFSVVVPKGAKHEVVDIEDHLDKHRDRPRRKRGSYVVHDVPSFAAYYDKHHLPETEVWADTVAHTLVAVINAHTASPEAGYGDHCLSYAVTKTPAWNAWMAIDGKLLDQVAFAEHIEARAIDVVSPTSAQMLDIAQTFEAKTNVEFKSGELLSSGERKLIFEETTTAKAGQTGSVEIPKEIHLALVPFEGADAYKVTARFRYRISGEGKLALGVVLERPEDVVREAFLDVVGKVETAIGHSVLRGAGGTR